MEFINLVGVFIGFLVASYFARYALSNWWTKGQIDTRIYVSSAIVSFGISVLMGHPWSLITIYALPVVMILVSLVVMTVLAIFDRIQGRRRRVLDMVSRHVCSRS